MNHVWKVLLCVASVGCATAAESEGSGPGLDGSHGTVQLSVLSEADPVVSSTSVDPVSITVAGFKPHAPVCADFPWYEEECRYFACQGETCLAIQMCWRVDENGARCAFWDYPDDLCCPDTAGQVVDAS